MRATWQSATDEPGILFPQGESFSCPLAGRGGKPEVRLVLLSLSRTTLAFRGGGEAFSSKLVHPHPRVCNARKPAR